MGVNELLTSNPKLGIIILSVAITFLLTILTKHTTNQNRMRELKDIQKACNIKLKEARKSNDTKSMEEVNKQMFSCSMELMKHSFKPMFITMIPLLFLFWWLRRVMEGTTIASVWIWYYIIAAIVASIIFRRALKVV